MWETEPHGSAGPAADLYRLTPKGNRRLQRGRGEWQTFVETLGAILGKHLPPSPPCPPPPPPPVTCVRNSFKSNSRSSLSGPSIHSLHPRCVVAILSAHRHPRALPRAERTNRDPRHAVGLSGHRMPDARSFPSTTAWGFIARAGLTPIVVPRLPNRGVFVRRILAPRDFEPESPESSHNLHQLFAQTASIANNLRLDIMPTSQRRC